MTPHHIAIIGAGPMGLICAYRLLQQGHKISVFERDDRIGGMSASFDFDGLRIERFYHFICRRDAPLLNALDEFGVADKLRWRKTKMGFFYQGTLYKWGTPLDLLSFGKLDMMSRLRYALHIFYSTHTRNYRGLDRKNAVKWLQHWLGARAYTILWDSLLTFKYYEFRHDLSAAWIAARIKRVAQSRKNMCTELLGYLEGGSETLLNKIVQRIKGLGGEIHLQADVTRVRVAGNKVRGLEVNGALKEFDAVISTIPMPYVPAIVPELPPEISSRIEKIANVGVVCVVLKLAAPISANFWTNINDPRIEIPAIIEYSNLYALLDNIVYVPYYMPHTHPKYKNTDEQFIEEVKYCLSIINPAFHESQIKAVSVTRYGFAQPVCTTNFFQALPPVETGIEGFLMADTTYYYPEDRSMSESIKLGEKLAHIFHASK